MADRLDESTWRLWQERLTRAFAIIEEHAPERHQELAAGLRAIAPIATAPGLNGRSATYRYAFGGFATGLPAGPEDLAVTTIHEFQHSKLNALTDVIRLYDPVPRTSYFAPWRTDPRPVGGLLHGTYAFAAVADFWDTLRSVPAFEATATDRAARVRAEVHRALGQLAAAPELTETGRYFVAMLTGELARRARPLPREAERRAARRLAAVEHAWHGRQPADRPPRS